MRTDLIFKNIPVELADKLVKLAMEYTNGGELEEESLDAYPETEDSEMSYLDFLNELNSRLGDLTVVKAIKLIGSVITLSDHETYDEDLEEIIGKMNDDSLTFSITTDEIEVLTKVMSNYKLTPSLFYESTIKCLESKKDGKELSIHDVVNLLDYDKFQR